MTTEELKTKIFGKTETGERYTFRQWLTFGWAGGSLAFLAMVEDAPLWVYALLMLNLAAAFHQVKKLPIPADPEDDEWEDDDEEE